MAVTPKTPINSSTTRRNKTEDTLLLGIGQRVDSDYLFVDRYHLHTSSDVSDFLFQFSACKGRYRRFKAHLCRLSNLHKQQMTLVFRGNG